ncbi:MAG: TatD family hydrolase [Gammaproteobacteria bacterium]
MSDQLLVDSHCHLDRLDLTHFTGGLEEVMAQALEHGVGHMLCVSIDLETFPAVLQLAQRFDNVFASVGVHPNERDGENPSVERLLELAQHARIIAIGETGLDYFRSDGDLDWQRERFRTHIRASKISGKPLIVHSRDAKQDTLRILREEGAEHVGGVMHCFTEDLETAQQAMDLNFYISLSGIVTFSSAKELKKVAMQLPLDRLLVETDSPYLAPVPFRGKANQPAYVRHVAQYIAELRGVPFELIAQSTTQNFFDLFGCAVANTHL